jgi:nucleoside-diphosphate-sugar epimerase
LIGTTAIYGIVTKNDAAQQYRAIVDENTPPQPQTLYAESKLESEEICRKVCEANQIALTISVWRRSSAKRTSAMLTV